MVRKLTLVGGVGVALLVTFVLVGGNVMPALSGHHATTAGTVTAPTSSQRPTSSASPATPSASATGTSATSTPAAAGTSDAPGQAAVSAETLAKSAPVSGKVLTDRPNPRRKPPPPVLTFRMATYNALGSSHTHKGGHRKQKASGRARTARAGRYVLDNDLSVVGFQEMQGDQRGAFMGATGGRYALYPGDELRGLDGENSIAYRLDTWQLVEARTVPIPYFGGHPRNMPVLLLRNKQTGITAYFANFHNPADTAEFGKQGRWRAAAKAREVDLLSQLRGGDYPIFVTGDMNEKQSWFCATGPAGDLVAAAATVFGQSGCDVPGFRIDWIAGSEGVTFSDYHEDKSGLVAWMTDHPVVTTDATIDAAKFPKSVGEKPAS